jgi:hypothetical protein
MKVAPIVIYSKDKPEEVLQQLWANQHGGFILEACCLNSNKRHRQGDANCPECFEPIINGSHSLLIRLASSEVNAEGFFGKLLSSWNPCSLRCTVKPFGNGSKLEFITAGTVWWLEIVVLAVICALLWCGYLLLCSPASGKIYLYSFFILFAPVLYFRYRKGQAWNLLAFVEKRVPQLIKYADHPELQK